MHITGTFAASDWARDTAKALEAFADEHRSELSSAAASGTFPREIYSEMGRRGWVGCITPTQFGGAGGGVREYCLIEEEVGRTMLVSPQISVQGQWWLIEWGTEEQQEKYLAGIAAGDLIFSESISEPGAGSSLRSIQASAVRDGSDWLLNGHKTHVNLGAQSDVTLFYANAPEGLTAFLVDADCSGFTRAETDPVGLRMIPTADMVLEDVRVPASAVLGEVGGGMDTFLSTFNTSRLGNASELIGFARRSLSDAVKYARSRQVGNNVVTDFQGIQWTLADAYSRLHGASLARDHAAEKAANGEGHAVETSLAKKMAIEAAEFATNEAFALVGGHGLYFDQEYTRLLLDTKVLRVAGGSLEVLRNHVARSVLKDDALLGLA